MNLYRITGNVFAFDPAQDVMGVVWLVSGSSRPRVPLVCTNATPADLTCAAPHPAGLAFTPVTAVGLECE